MYTHCPWSIYLAALLATSMSVANAESKPQHSQNSQSKDKKLSTIVVTGELLHRSVQDSGNSVSVMDSEALEARSDLKSIRDALRETPNITDVTGTGKAPTVRGVDGTGPAENANAFFAGSRPRLNWQIDGRSASYNEVVFGDIGIWDLERIEVLRGPQSTLAGRNSIAGTVRVETRDPEAERQAALRIEGGNLNQKRASLMYNQPISDTLAIRFAADKSERKSAVEYDPYPGIEDPAQIEGHMLRGKILFTPEGERKTRLLVSISETEYQAPNSEIIVRPYAEKRSNFPQQPVHNPRTRSLAMDFSSNLSDALRLELNTSTTDFKFERKTAPTSSKAEVNTDEYAVEARLRYSGNSDSEWVAGVMLYNARQNEWIQFGSILRFNDKSDTRAVYAEGRIPIAAHYELTLGLRYEEEDRQRGGGDPTRETVNIQADKTYSALLPKLGLSFSPNEQHVVGIYLSRGYNAGGGGVSFGVFPIVNYEYEEEYVNSIEFFGRQQWSNMGLQTTQNLFYSLYEDMQLPFDLTPQDSRDEAFVVRNADEVRTMGLELGVSWQPSAQWTLFSQFALLDTEVTEYPGSGIEGNALFTAPSAAMQFGGSWSDQRWTVHFSGHITDGWYTSINNHPDNKTKAHGTFNTSASYQFTKNIKMYVAARNLFDDDVAVAIYPGVTPEGSDLPDTNFESAVLQQPRTITAGLQLNF